MTDATATGYLAMLEEIDRYWHAMNDAEQEQVTGKGFAPSRRVLEFAPEGWVRMLAREEIAKALHEVGKAPLAPQRVAYQMDALAHLDDSEDLLALTQAELERRTAWSNEQIAKLREVQEQERNAGKLAVAHLEAKLQAESERDTARAEAEKAVALSVMVEKALQAKVARAVELLERLDRKGGLGLDAHAVLEQAIGALR